jgi:hypothetical protein
MPTEEFTQTEVDRRVRNAIDRLLERDAYLLRVDASERSITHKLAEWLQKEFRGWDVDCEYNRDGCDSKTLDLAPNDLVKEDDTCAQTVFPDIIVHHRGPDDNLLVIEAKKSTNLRPEEWDRRKLRAFKEQLRYRHALFVKFFIGAEPARPQFEWIRPEHGHSTPQSHDGGASDDHLRNGT